jgi:ribose transport system substrate-binding protein
MKFRRKSPRFAVPAVAALTLFAAACGGNNDRTGQDGQTTGSGKRDVLVGFANIAAGDPTLTALDQGMKAEAERRGWETMVLNNKLDPQTAVANAQTMISRDVDYAIEFQFDRAVQRTIARRFKEADTPLVALDIPAPGAYFLGAPNNLAGQQAGEALGRHAKQEWDCQPDLVILLQQAAVGTVSQLRVDGAREGIQKVCPEIAPEVFEVREGGATAEEQQETTRNILNAHPNAQRVLASGINDFAVLSIIQAAKQLGRAEQLYGWGLDGSQLLQGNAPRQLAGSVAFFLEGYPKYVFQLLDRLERGEDVPVGDTPDSSSAILVDSCLLTRADAGDVPPVEQRIERLKTSADTTAHELFCPQQ